MESRIFWTLELLGISLKVNSQSLNKCATESLRYTSSCLTVNMLTNMLMKINLQYIFVCVFL